MIHAAVDSMIRLDEAELPPKMLPLLHQTLSAPNPEYSLRQRMGRWTGNTPENLTLIGYSHNGELALPRGAVAALKAAAVAAGRRVVFDDQRVSFEAEEYGFSFSLRDYQEEAAAALVHNTQGVVVLPCGGGKTVVGAAVIARLGQPALVLVHTHDLLEQWRNTLRDALGVEPGIIAGGELKPDRVTVATIQTLITLGPSALWRLGQRFGLVIIDEAHHVPSETFRLVLGRIPAKYRFGLTATPERADGLTPLLTFGLGPIVFDLKHQRLVDAGYLVIPEVYRVDTNISVEADDYTELVSALCKHEARNRQLLQLASECAHGGRCTLILSGRVTHCEQLAAALNEDGIDAAALTGRVPKKKRTALLGLFRAGELPILCATSLADEGLDVSRLERLILATPARAEGRTIQRLGRLMRPHPGKATPILYDLVDDHPMAQRHHAARRYAYRKALGDVAIRSYT